MQIFHQVTNELDLEVQGEISPALIEQGTVESPTVVMSVTARWVTLSFDQDINITCKIYQIRE